MRTEQIFINYRRNDSQWVAALVYKALLSEFSKQKVFMDIDNIPSGVNFVNHIEEYISHCDLLIAIIGKDWLEQLNNKASNKLNDYVMLEIASALKQGIPIIPLLVGDTKIPELENLPVELRPLHYLNALSITYNRLDDDLPKLINSTKYLLKTRNLIDTTEMYPRFLFLAALQGTSDKSYFLMHFFNYWNFVFCTQEDVQNKVGWNRPISEVIKDAGAVIVIWTKSSIKSNTVINQALQAFKLGKYIPVRLELVEIPYPMHEIPTLDLCNWNGDVDDPEIDGLFWKLNKLIDRRTSSNFSEGD